MSNIIKGFSILEMQGDAQLPDQRYWSMLFKTKDEAISAAREVYNTSELKDNDHFYVCVGNGYETDSSYGAFEDEELHFVIHKGVEYFDEKAKKWETSHADIVDGIIQGGD